jgi:hypothetical protein
MAGEEEKLRLGGARLGVVWCGVARTGKDSFRVGGGSANRYGMAWRGEARHGEVGQGMIKATEFSQPPFSIDRKQSICLDALTRGEIPHRTQPF